MSAWTNNYINKLCREGKLDVDQFFPIKFVIRGFNRNDLAKHVKRLRKSHGNHVAKCAIDHAKYLEKS